MFIQLYINISPKRDIQPRDVQRLSQSKCHHQASPKWSVLSYMSRLHKTVGFLVAWWRKSLDALIVSIICDRQRLSLDWDNQDLLLNCSCQGPNVCLVRRVINKDSYSNEINKYEGCGGRHQHWQAERSMSPPGVILSGISHCVGALNS